MRRLLIASAALAAGILILSFAVGELLTRPARAAIGPPPSGLAAETLRIPYGDGQQVSGWFLPGRAGEGTVLPSSTSNRHFGRFDVELGVPGAAHVDLHGFNARAYEVRLLPWLRSHLRKVSG